MRDIVHNLGVVQAIAPADIAATTNGAAVDLLGFDSVALIAVTGAITGSGVFSMKLQESDDAAAWSDVPASLYQVSIPGNLAANGIAKVGYRGFKRYVRPVLTKASGTSILVSVVALKGRAAERPVA